MSDVFTKLAAARDLLNAHKPEAALSHLQRLAPKLSADPDFCSLMAQVLGRLNRPEQAVFYANRALQARPDDPQAHFQLGFMLTGMRRLDEAGAAFRAALARQPNFPDARLALANTLLESNRASEALDELRAGLSFGPHDQLSVSYANALLSVTDVEEAVEFLRVAVGQFPRESLLVGGLPAALNNMHGADPREIAAGHRAFGALMMRTRPAFATPASTRAPGAPLKVGIISPDLRTHSVAFFAEPFFLHHDRARIRLHAYSVNLGSDAITQRLKSACAVWRECGLLTPMQVAQRIAEDRLDVLVDLAGHTDATCLAVLALRPAPVQVTYCGYPDTTGLPTVDYRVVDSRTDPPGAAAPWNGGISFDDRATEKLIRLDPCFLCYKPPADAPAPARDAEHPGPVFGSFNACKKLSRGVIALWSRVLLQTPGSRLLIKAFDLRDPAVKERMHQRFAQHGVEASRLEFIPATKGIAEHLTLYARMDVALDPTPYNGTTTTCEAVWMGVPVVTVAGTTHASRVGVSLLSTIGVPELIARDEDHYVALAGELVRDAARLKDYRATLRTRMAASPLLDGPGFAMRLESALIEGFEAASAAPRHA